MIARKNRTSIWDTALQNQRLERDINRRRELVKLRVTAACPYKEDRFTQGKYQYRKISDVFCTDPAYLGWLYKKRPTFLTQNQFAAVDWFIHNFPEVFVWRKQ